MHYENFDHFSIHFKYFFICSAVIMEQIGNIIFIVDESIVNEYIIIKSKKMDRKDYRIYQKVITFRIIISKVIKK